MKTLLLAFVLAAFTSQEKPPRLLDLLDQSGQQYEKAGEGWNVKFKGNNIKEISIYVAQADAMIVLGTVIALKSEIRDEAALNSALLQANESYDFIKTTIDDDGDYRLRLDLLAPGLTPTLFSDQLVQIATIYDLLKPTIDKFRKK